MHPMVNIALQAARDAAEAIAHSSDRLDRVKIINDDPKQFMTSMDQISDKTLRYHIEKAHPEHGIDSRVSGIKVGENKSVVWLLEPLLGNQNFAKGYTQFGVSLACQIDGIITHAVIACPLMHEEYTASRGTGAQLNARRLRVGKATDLDDTLIGLNPDDLAIEDFLKLQGELLANNSAPRISGCTGVDMVQAAADRLQGGWASTRGGKYLGASTLILQEAGGLIGGDSGNPDYADADEIIYGNPKIFKHLLKLRKQARS